MSKKMFWSMALAMALASCSNEELANVENGDSALKAVFESPVESRVGFNKETDGSNVKWSFYWHQYDQIWVNGKSMKTNDADYSTSATFTTWSSVNTTDGYAIYPFNVGKDCVDNNNVLTYEYPSSYQYVAFNGTYFAKNENMPTIPMYAEVDNGSAAFKHLGGVIIVRFNGWDVTGTHEFTLTTNKQITGTFTSDLDESPEFKATTESSQNNKVTFSFTREASAAAEDLVFYIPVPTGSYTAELKMTVNGSSEFEESANITINRADFMLAEFGKSTLVGGAEVSVATADAFLDALNTAKAGTTIALENNIELNGGLIFGAPTAARSTSTSYAGRDIIIDGNNGTITFTGKTNDRLIDVTKETNGMNLTLKNVTLVNECSYVERGVNYNTNGILTLENVTIESNDGCSINYAVNLPGSSDNATVVIKNSNIGATAQALNIWGENVKADVTDSDLYVIDNNEIEGYSVISLCNDGTTSAEGTVVTVTGGSLKVTGTATNGSLAVQNGTITGDVKVSDTTEVVGEIKQVVVVVYYNGYDQFYSGYSLEGAINKAVETNAAGIRLIRDIEVNGTITVEASDYDVKLDLNGHTVSGVNNKDQGHMIMVNNGATLTITDSSSAQTGKISYAQGTSNVGWAIDLEGTLNLQSGTIELTGDSWSIGYAVDVRPNSWGSEYQNATTFNMSGGKVISSDGAIRVASSSTEAHSKVSANFNMTGGEINAAYDGLFIQQSDKAYDVLNVNISNGTLKSDMYPIRLYGPVATSKVGDSSLTISGGIFSKVAVEGKTALVEDFIYLAGGISAEDIYYTKIDITGGSFENGNKLTAYSMSVKEITDGVTEE